VVTLRFFATSEQSFVLFYLLSADTLLHDSRNKFYFFFFYLDGLGFLASFHSGLIMKLWIKETVGRTPWTSDQPCRKAATYTGQHKYRNERVDIHASSGIRKVKLRVQLWVVGRYAVINCQRKSPRNNITCTADRHSHTRLHVSNSPPSGPEGSSR
jgi:hypothetical protein